MPETYYTEAELQNYFSRPKSRRTNSNQNDSSEAVKKRALKAVGILGLLSLGLALMAMLFLLFLSRNTPTFEQLENPDLSLATTVYTADGRMLTRYAFQDRTTVPYDSISPHVIHALVATEDFRFHDHWGIDIYRTVGSIAKTLLGDRQGGSTITQQLARNLYREQVGTEISPVRKLREMITAFQLERSYTKREIIEMYLNTVSWGYNTYGIETAAQTYFGVPASDLTMEQAAVLIGMQKATTAYNPVRNPERSRTRRNVVLNQMVRFGNLPPAVADSVKALPLELDFRRLTHIDNLAPFFAEEVRLFIDRWAEENGFNTYSDGLVVYTTLDSRLQALAQEAVDRQMVGLQTVVDVEHSSAGTGLFFQEIEPYMAKAEEESFKPFDRFWERESGFVDSVIREADRYNRLVNNGSSRADAIQALRQDEAFMDSLRADITRLEVGLVAVDPNTRHVKAWVGGRDYNLGKVDHVSGTRRQPGSTFKPFLYTAAIDNGYSPYYTLLDDTVTIMMPGMPKPWTPSNSDGIYSGHTMTLQDGLRTSTNTIAARLVAEVGPEQVKTYAERMGIESPLEAVPSIALGTSDVTLLEMSNAYATLANGGFYGEPIIVTRIEDRSGRVLADFVSGQQEVLSENTAYTIIDMMRGVLMAGGTGVRIRAQFGIDSDVAGKTGTTQNGADGWFMLMHPQMVVGAWVGFNKPSVTFRTSFWGQGAHNALFVVGDFFKNVLASEEINLPDHRFLPPDGWTVPLPMDVADSDKLGGDKKGRVGW